jgi:hypothetical protein
LGSAVTGGAGCGAVPLAEGQRKDTTGRSWPERGPSWTGSGSRGGPGRIGEPARGSGGFSGEITGPLHAKPQVFGLPAAESAPFSRLNELNTGFRGQWCEPEVMSPCGVPPM